MSITNGYITLAELQNFDSSGGGADNYTPADETNMEMAIEAVSRWLDDHLNTSFYARTETRYYTAEFSDLLWIDDLLTVTTLKTDDNGDGTYENTWTASTDYQLEPRNAALGSQPKPYRQIRVNDNGSYSFPTGVDWGVEIAGTWGYCTLANIPKEIKYFVLMACQRLFLRKDSPFGVAGAPALGVQVIQAKIEQDADLMMLLGGVDRRGW